MFGNPIERLIESLLELLGVSIQSTLEAVAAALYQVPFPPIGDDIFQSIYARMFGLALIISLPLLGIAFLRSAFQPNKYSLSRLLSHLPMTIVFSMLLPAASALMIILGNEFTVAFSKASSGEEGEQLLLLQIIDTLTISDLMTRGFLMGVNWGFSIMLMFEVIVVVMSSLLLVLLGPVMYGWARFSNGPQLLWRLWVGALMSAIFTKPAIALLLMVASWLNNEFIAIIAPGLVQQVFVTMVLALAALIPPFLFFTFASKVAPGWRPTSVTMEVQQKQTVVRTVRRAVTAETGQHVKTKVQERVKVPERPATGGALGTTATISAAAAARAPDPRARAALMGLSFAATAASSRSRKNGGES